MSKKAIQILCLILSIVSLLYLIMSYCGYMRLIKLHLLSVEYYTGLYLKKPKVGKGRVVVSMNKSNDFELCLKSILDQTVRVDDIGIVTETTRLAGKKFDTKHKVLNVYFYDRDYGDMANMICSVLREPDKDTKIILIEPNIIYGEDFVEKMIEESDKYPDKIIQLRSTPAYLIKPDFFCDKISMYKKNSNKGDWLKVCCKAGTRII